MRYQMREKLWSIRDSFDIKDESGRKVYSVKGRFLTWGNKLVMRDRNDDQVARISQRKLSLRPRYKILRDGQTVGVVKKNFLSVFRDKFTVSMRGSGDYRITGSILDYNYKFERGGETVAQVSKRFFSLRDTYGIDIKEGEDDVAILAACIVIDMVAHNDD